MKVKDLKPALVWEIFDAITQVPRPSKKEEKIRAYLLDFAKQHNLEVATDEIGNVVMTVPATPGYEEAPTVILQAHMDMVCEKNSDVELDFENDPIQTYIDGEWVRARGTTLGADNGIGMAAAMAVLIDPEAKHGRLQALFTVDEETGLTGANNLDGNLISGDILLNLDSEDDAQIFIGCAGGIDTTSTFTYTEQAAPQDYYYATLRIKGLNGGHSGGDIHHGRGNANKILARFLWNAMKKYDVKLATIDGGNLRNAIPREAMAVIGVPVQHKEDIRVDFNCHIATVEDELRGVDALTGSGMETADVPATCIDDKTAHNLISALYAAPHGVIAMSRELPGLVQTSTNLASVKMREGNTIVVATSQRSSVESEKYDIANQIEALFAIAGAEPAHGEGYPGWKPNMQSAIKDIAVEAYEELFNVTPEILAIHAGLECGLFLSKYPHLDMISFGPTLRDVHSPDERMHIPAVEKFWLHLLRILEKVAVMKK
ncbi:MAG: aminoacyl-histidine dipeptidase [Bacteroidaceae bacterium]|nr:aminoacyl-histidine dipeptidase [Bacteroidaceae bacterium]